MRRHPQARRPSRAWLLPGANGSPTHHCIHHRDTHLTYSASATDQSRERFTTAQLLPSDSSHVVTAGEVTARSCKGQSVDASGSQLSRALIWRSARNFAAVSSRRVSRSLTAQYRCPRAEPARVTTVSLAQLFRDRTGGRLVYDHAESCRGRGRLATVRHAELEQDRRDVVVDGLRCDH